MGLQLTFWGIEETDSGNTKRRALAYFATDSARATPGSMAFVATDTDATPLSERTAGTPVATTADSTTGGQAALPALASRRWFVLTNLSATTIVYWRFGATITKALAMPLRPGGTVSFSGDLPNDALRVICDTGQTADVVGQQC